MSFEHRFDPNANYIHPAEGEGSEFREKAYHKVKFFLSGNGLDIGCGGWKVPGSIGIDLRPGSHIDITGDIRHGLDKLLPENLKKEYDFIVSSHLIEDFNEEDQKWLIKDWLRYLKTGGYLILYAPERGKFTGVNYCHQREFAPGEMEYLFSEMRLEQIGDVDYESREEPGRYGVLGVARKV